jgi:hypothetical protein
MPTEASLSFDAPNMEIANPPRRGGFLPSLSYDARALLGKRNRTLSHTHCSSLVYNPCRIRWTMNGLVSLPGEAQICQPSELRMSEAGRLGLSPYLCVLQCSMISTHGSRRPWTFFVVSGHLFYRWPYSPVAIQAFRSYHLDRDGTAKLVLLEGDVIEGPAPLADHFSWNESD